MGILSRNLERMKLDKRVVQNNIQIGVITETEYDTHIKELQDLTSNATEVTLEDEPDVD